MLQDYYFIPDGGVIVSIFDKVRADLKNIQGEESWFVVEYFKNV